MDLKEFKKCIIDDIMRKVMNYIEASNAMKRLLQPYGNHRIPLKPIINKKSKYANTFKDYNICFDYGCYKMDSKDKIVDYKDYFILSAIWNSTTFESRSIEVLSHLNEAILDVKLESHNSSIEDLSKDVVELKSGYYKSKTSQRSIYIKDIEDVSKDGGNIKYHDVFHNPFDKHFGETSQVVRFISALSLRDQWVHITESEFRNICTKIVESKINDIKNKNENLMRQIENNRKTISDLYKIKNNI